MVNEKNLIFTIKYVQRFLATIQKQQKIAFYCSFTI